MINNPLLSLFGIMRKAGKLTVGYDAVVESVNKNQSYLVITACDISPRSLRSLTEDINSRVNIKQVPYTMEEIGHAIGHMVRIVSITDEGFAKKALSLIDKIEEE